jgi:hypothetical protein
MIVDPVIEQQVIERMGQMYYEFAVALRDLNDIRTGKVVVVPQDMDHARTMVLMGQHYIDECHQETFNALTKTY